MTAEPPSGEALAAGGAPPESPTPAAPGAAEEEARRGRRMFRNTAIFSVATGLSRIAGLAREIVASAIFGLRVEIAAFTVAFSIPNLLRSLVADAALGAAFVPVFTELLEQKRRREAFELASALFGLILVAVGALTLLAVALSPVLVPLFTGPRFGPEDDALTVGLTQVMFPIVVLLGLNGLVVGILNAYDHFSVPAIAPLVWNVVIIGCLVGLRGLFEGREEIYAYAIGILAGTAVQFAMTLPVLRRVGFPLRVSLGWGDPRIRQVLKLMLPVTIGLGLINFNVFINYLLGTFVSDGAARAIDAAFRIYMLPQGMFSVAVATVLFPALARLAARGDRDGLRDWSGSGVRQIALLLIPSAAAMAVLAEPITRLVYERGNFDPRDTEAVAEALLWFSFSLPFAGANLMLTRTFFSLQRPWTPTKLAGLSLLINLVVSIALLEALGIAGIVIGTVAGSAAMAVAQAAALRRELGGFQIARTLRASLAMVVAAVGFGAAAWAAWRLLDEALGRSLLAQMGSVGAGLTAGSLVYAGLVLLMRVPEAEQVGRLIARRLGRDRAA